MKYRYYKIDTRYLYVMTSSLLKKVMIRETDADLYILASEYKKKAKNALEQKNKRYLINSFDLLRIANSFFAGVEESDFGKLKNVLQENNFGEKDFLNLKNKDVKSLMNKEKRNLDWFFRNSDYIKKMS